MQARFMALDFRADAWAEMDYLTSLGVDGFFTDCPPTAAAWRAARLAARTAAASPAGGATGAAAAGPEGRQEAQDAGQAGSGARGWHILGGIMLGASIGAVVCGAAAAGIGWAIGRSQQARQGYRTLERRYSMGGVSAGAVQQARAEGGYESGYLSGLGFSRLGGQQAAEARAEEASRMQQLAERSEQWPDRPAGLVLQPVASDAAALAAAHAGPP